MGHYRFIDSALWKKDWFLDLSSEHRVFWYYLQAHCNHAGIWQPSWREVKYMMGFDQIDPAVYKEEVRILAGGLWYLTSFVCSQQMVPTLMHLNPKNACHASIIKILNKENIISPFVAPVKGLDRGYSNSNGNGKTQPNTSSKDNLNYLSNSKMNKDNIDNTDNIGHGIPPPPTMQERDAAFAISKAENYDTPAWRQTLKEEVASFRAIGFNEEKIKQLFMNRPIAEAIVDEVMDKRF